MNEAQKVLIKCVEIKNFRGIKEGKVEDLSLINTFIGVNNSGKSTLLDAIYLACKEPAESCLSTVMKERVQREVKSYEIFFGYNKKSTAKIKLSYNTGHNYSISFSLAKENIKGTSKIGTTVDKGQLAAHFENEDDTLYITAYNSDLSMARTFESFPASIKDIQMYCNEAALYSSTVRKNNLTTALDESLSKIKNNSELEDELNKIMIDIYDEFDYEFVPNPEDYKDRRVAFKQGPYRVFSDFHGDGEQRALSFLANLELSTDTAIFIEEIEMFQHPRALRKLAKHMVELAKKNKVQLFISTHNYYDALRFFYYAFENDEERNELLRNYLITRREGLIEVKLENNVQNILEEVYRDIS